MCLVKRKPVFGVFEQVRLKPASAATEASYRLEILDIETGYIILSRQWTIKVLIRLRRCEGWSAPLLVAYGINRFSHDVTQVLRHTSLGTQCRPRPDCSWAVWLSGWARTCKSVSYAICEQQRHRSACVSAQSDQHLCFRCLDSMICIIVISKVSRF